MIVKTPILPQNQHFAKVRVPHQLNREAICIFAATGFFLDGDTYWKDEVCLLPGHTHEFDDNGYLVSSEKCFDWHYSPREISFETALEEYIELLKDIIKDQIGDNPVILPLSGGLDSRSQALILKDFENTVQSYSYSFQGGYPEHSISEKIAKVCHFDFKAFKIPKGYLWNSIDQLAEINKCYSEFTHPRQMAVLDEFKKMEGIFSLGHWGDVFFDRGVPSYTEEKDVMTLLLKKMVKKGGMELAEKLWQTWQLEGKFKEYLITRIETSLSKIKIDNLSAKVRAFKTSQWAYRWTTTNLSVFEAAHSITLPYYDNRMCEFICTVPEEYLADRRLQLAHLKQDKALSNIIWHAQKPFNINNYHYNKYPYNIPFRIADKLKRELNSNTGRPYIQRNWELQFLGEENRGQLEKRILNSEFSDFVPKMVTDEIYKNFRQKDTVYWSHPVSILLTLSLWHQHFNNN